MEENLQAHWSRQGVMLAGNIKVYEDIGEEGGIGRRWRGQMYRPYHESPSAATGPGAGAGKGAGCGAAAGIVACARSRPMARAPAGALARAPHVASTAAAARAAAAPTAVPPRPRTGLRAAPNDPGKGNRAQWGARTRHSAWRGSSDSGGRASGPTARSARREADETVTEA